MVVTLGQGPLLEGDTRMASKVLAIFCFLIWVLVTHCVRFVKFIDDLQVSVCYVSVICHYITNCAKLSGLKQPFILLMILWVRNLTGAQPDTSSRRHVASAGVAAGSTAKMTSSLPPSRVWHFGVPWPVPPLPASFSPSTVFPTSGPPHRAQTPHGTVVSK